MEHQHELKGLGGWLILLGIGVILSPIRILATYAPLYIPIFSDGTWEALTTIGSDAYHPLWEPLLTGEIIFNVTVTVISTYLIYLFFSKHYLFPKFYISLVLVSLLFIPLDAWLVTFVLPDNSIFDPATTKEFSRTLVGVLIWVPYLLLSKRVKATFIEKLPQKQFQAAAESIP